MKRARSFFFVLRVAAFPVSEVFRHGLLFTVLLLALLPNALLLNATSAAFGQDATKSAGDTGATTAAISDLAQATQNSPARDAAREIAAHEPAAGSADAEGGSTSAATGSQLAQQVLRLEAHIRQLRQAGNDQAADNFEQGLTEMLANMERTALRAIRGASRVPADLSEEQAAVDSPGAIVAAAESDIAWLATRGHQAQAKAFAAELAPLKQSLLSDEFVDRPTGHPEVHAVHVRRGSTLPRDYWEGNNRFSVGFVELELQHRDCPTVLVLSGDQPLIWKITTSDGARLNAVVFASANQAVRDTRVENLFQLDPGRIVGQNRRWIDPLFDLVGSDKLTSLQIDAYEGSPIIVGPRNASWREQYLLPKVRALRSRVQTEQRKLQLVDFSALRFSALHFTRLGGENYGPSPLMISLAEHTVLGPLIERMTPLSSQPLLGHVETGGETGQFGISAAGRLVVIDATKAPHEELADVPLDGKLQHENSFAGLAYDPGRDRLLLATCSSRAKLLAFQLKTSTWSELGERSHPIVTVAYDASQDDLWLLEIDQSNRRRPVSIVRLSAGNLQQRGRTEIQDAETQRLIQRLYPQSRELPLQLVAAGEWLALILPPEVQNNQNGQREPIADPLRLLDPTDGSLAYAGPLLPHRADDLPEEVLDRRLTQKMPAGSGPLALLYQRFERLGRAAEQLQSLGQNKQADRFRREADRLDQALTGGDIPTCREPRVLLLSAVTTEAKVQLRDRSGPIILALASMQEMEWNVEVGQGVQLQEIVASGYQEPKVKVANANVPLRILSAQQGNEVNAFVAAEHDPEQWSETLRKIRRLCGRDVSLVGSITPTGGGNDPYDFTREAGWRVSVISAALDELLRDAPAEETRLRSEFLQARFHGVFLGAMPERGQGARPPANAAPGLPAILRRRQRALERYFAEMTVEGPLIGHTTRLEDNFELATTSPDGKYAFLHQMGQEVVELEVATGKRVELKRDANSPEMNWPSGMCVDSKRNRLIVVSSFNAQRLLACDLVTRKWSSFGSLISLDGVAYDSKTDLLYGLEASIGNGSTSFVHVLNSAGSLVQRLQLSGTVRTPRHPHDGRTDLHVLEDKLVIFSYGRSVQQRGFMEQAEVQVAVVDLTSGDIVYETQARPHMERIELSDEKLTHFWQLLGDRALEADVVDRTLWDMAAGHDRTVRYLEIQLRAVLQQPLTKVDPDMVARLIAQLDENKFARRAEAFRELQQLGSSIEPLLREPAESHASGEVRARLRQLLESWAAMTPQNGYETTWVRALDVLARIGSEAAKELTTRVSGAEQFPSVVRKHARDGLANWQSPEVE